MPNEHRNPSQAERDERIALPLDPEVALSGLLAVDPEYPSECQCDHSITDHRGDDKGRLRWYTCQKCDCVFKGPRPPEVSR